MVFSCLILEFQGQGLRKKFRFFFAPVNKTTKIQSILLMVQKSQTTTWDGAKTKWDKLSTSTSTGAGFLNHQQYGRPLSVEMEVGILLLSFFFGGLSTASPSTLCETFRIMGVSPDLTKKQRNIWFCLGCFCFWSKMWSR